MVPVVVQPSDDRRRGTELQRRVVYVGSGSVYGFEELGHEIEIVSGGFQKLGVFGNLVSAMSALGDIIQDAETNLL